MATALTMEEELQQSVWLSEEAEYNGHDNTAENGKGSYHSHSEGKELSNMHRDASTGSQGEGHDADRHYSDVDSSGEDMDEDASGEDETQLVSLENLAGNGTPEDDNEDEDVAELAEVEQDLVDEGVGAVKMKPTEFDNDTGESDVSDLPSVPEDESDDDEAAWVEENAADEDDESDVVPMNVCLFCKQNEENDPSEDFEAFLACTRCGENAHQQCARDASAIDEENTSNGWKCPECSSGSSDSENNIDLRAVDGGHGEASYPRDVGSAPLSLTQKDSGVWQEATSCTEVSESPRTLRKRKISSVEPEESMTMRKRRRATSHDSIAGHEDDDRFADQHRTSRGLRLKASRPPPVRIDKQSRTSLVIVITLRPGNLKEILSRKKRDKRLGGDGSRAAPPAQSTPMRTPARSTARSTARPLARTSDEITVTAGTSVSSLPPPFTSDLYLQPFYSFFDKETDDAQGKPYGGILSEAEADTSKKLPNPEDRKRFDQAKQKAEDEWRARVLAMQVEAELPARKPKRTNDNVSQIECIQFGSWEIDTWYAAPYPAEYSRNRVLYICEFCLKYMNSDYVAWRHKLKCATKHPPGDEIYRHGSVSIFEVDGRKHPVYCQNLCLLAKLFLGSKTLYYDVEPFLFYILCEYDECGYHFVGYFSKEKRASSQNNVSCILTLPIHQRKGYGNLLIDFSYLLTKVEQKSGSPEKPLSDMGLVSYRNYWRLEMCRYFLSVMESEKYKEEGLSVRQISDDTGMTADDVVSALEGLRALVRDPQTHLYAFRVDLDYYRRYVAKWESKGYVRLKPEALAWTPYVVGRSNAVNFELGPPISTIAPREEDEALQGRKNALADGSQDLPMLNGIETDPPATVDEEEGGEGEGEGKISVRYRSETLQSIEHDFHEPHGGSTLNDQDLEKAASDTELWSVAYQGIPATRFEVFPPIGSNRRIDRGRQSATRPIASRSIFASSRPKRLGGSSRRPTSSRPRPSSSRRRTGGTGRGPGRWPKGAKKSDYGNADSGPGLPPGWRDKQPRSQDVSDEDGEGYMETNGTLEPQMDGDGEKRTTEPSNGEEPAGDEVKDVTVSAEAATTNGKPSHDHDSQPEPMFPGTPGSALSDVVMDEGEADAEREKE